MVPLLQLDDGELVTESVVVARRIATQFDAHAQLLPAADAPAVDAFVRLWTEGVEPAYYDVLRAESESQAKFKTAILLEKLTVVEERLFASSLRSTG